VLALLIGLGALGLVLAWPRLKRAAARDRWRPGALAAATAALAGTAFTAVRGEWAEALVLLLAAALLATGVRRRRRSKPTPANANPGMSRREAASTLGVADTASSEAVQAAYARLIRRTHPDQGGTAGLAAQLNAARDVMLDKARRH